MKFKKLAIVDHVGIKSGMDYYDLGLLGGVNGQGVETFLFANIDVPKNNPIKGFNYFETKKTSDVKSLFNFIIAHLKSFYKCKRLGIDTIIIHLFSTYYKEKLQYVLARLFGLSIITIVHDVNDFLNKDNVKIKNFIYDNSKNLIVHNQFSFDSIQEHIEERHKAKIRIIPHGNYVDFINTKISKEVAKERLGLSKDKKYILFFGQIKAVKGLDLAIKAMTNLPEDVELIIAGRPRRFDYSEYTDLIKNLGLEKRILEFIRFIENDERDIFFSAADILILPYLRIYQSGVLLMAMSHGLPIIASDLPPNKEIITSGEDGMLFESENIQSLVKATQQCIHDNDLLDKFRQESIASIQGRFSWYKIAESYIKLI